MNFLVIADLDTLGWEGGRGHADALISCGDHFDQVILGAAEAFECEAIFAVKGNHDSAEVFPFPIKDMHLEVREFGGIIIGGLNGAWRYKTRGAHLYSQEEIEQVMAAFPPVDVFITHNSPRGIHDKNDGIHFGFDGLLNYIVRTRPGLVVHGHQHVNVETWIGSTRVVGVYGQREIVV